MIFNWLQRTGTLPVCPQLSPLIIFPWPQATRETHKVYRKQDMRIVHDTYFERATSGTPPALVVWCRGQPCSACEYDVCNVAFV